MTSEEFIFINISPDQCQRQVYGGSNGEDTIPVLAVNIDWKSKERFLGWTKAIIWHTKSKSNSLKTNLLISPFRLVYMCRIQKNFYLKNDSEGEYWM